MDINNLRAYLVDHVQARTFANLHSNKLASNSTRTGARDKLTRLSSAQFSELAVDVNDEALRRNSGSQQPLQPRPEFHARRNQARQKLAALPVARLKDLVSDVVYEWDRRNTPGAPTSQVPFGQSAVNAYGGTPGLPTSMSSRSIDVGMSGMPSGQPALASVMTPGMTSGMTPGMTSGMTPGMSAYSTTPAAPGQAAAMAALAAENMKLKTDLDNRVNALYGETAGMRQDYERRMAEARQEAQNQINMLINDVQVCTPSNTWTALILASANNVSSKRMPRFDCWKIKWRN